MWIELTEALIANRLTGAELTAMKSAALGAGQSGATVLSDAISAVVREVRGYVAGNKNNVLGDGETIPDELEHAALAVLRQRLGNRLPGLARLFAGEDRKAEYDDAMKLLRDVADGKFGIVPPTTEAAAQAGGPSVALVNSRSRVAKPSDLSGL